MRNDRGQFLKGAPAWNVKEKIRKECPYCGGIFYVKQALASRVCCSRPCACKLRFANAGHPSLGRKASDGTKAKQRAAKLGNGGPGHWNWRNGTSRKQRHLDMSRDDYIQWRKAVFARDSYTCQTCGATGELNAHHIKDYAKYVDLRYEVGNGITLCLACHKKITWGGGPHE